MLAILLFLWPLTLRKLLWAGRVFWWCKWLYRLLPNRGEMSGCVPLPSWPLCLSKQKSHKINSILPHQSCGKTACWLNPVSWAVWETEAVLPGAAVLGSGMIQHYGESSLFALFSTADCLVKSCYWMSLLFKCFLKRWDKLSLAELSCCPLGFPLFCLAWALLFCAALHSLTLPQSFGSLNLHSLIKLLNNVSTQLLLVLGGWVFYLSSCSNKRDLLSWLNLNRNSAPKMNLKNDQLCPALSLCARYFACVRLKEDFAVLHLAGTWELMPWHDDIGQPWSSTWGRRLE